MNIIIPLCGKGERFKNNGYILPKPLIKVFNKEIISYVLDNIYNTNNNIHILYNENVMINKFISFIKEKYPLINLIYINKQTDGAAETLLYGLDSICNNNPCLVLDGDMYYTIDIVDIIRNNINNNQVVYFKTTSTTPEYSYILLDDNKIIDIKEKELISQNANTGAYYFSDIHILKEKTKYIINNNIKSQNEYYISCIVKEYLNNSIDFYGTEINSNNIINLGTPLNVNKYINNTYAFLFDLDGTLVVTDNIYYDVWKDILNEYNIHLTKDIFDKYIYSQSDMNVINTLLCKDIDIQYISNKKDNLFIDNISKIQYIDGAISFIKYIKSLGHKVAIVTNCNRKTAEKIISYIGIEKYIDIIIIGNESKNPKPYPDPYINAIEYFDISSNRSIIFEDSKNGILSAKGITPKCIVGITTMYSSEELHNYGCNYTISNYNSININDICNYNNTHSFLIKYITNSLNKTYDIKNVYIHNNKLKGGFISDVLEVNIILQNDTILKTILKLECSNTSQLHNMANCLELYNREYYFYEQIYQYIHINTPKYIGTIKDDNYKTIGILLENLNTEHYTLNINLNKDDINTSLSVINSLAILHSQFWNKDITESFKQLKKANDALFNPTWSIFINERLSTFLSKWSTLLTQSDISLCKYIASNYLTIQESLSNNNLTLCHGDVKSPNIFYKKEKNKVIPYFIDWQYITCGKGVQDLVFFMIESFDIEQIKLYYPIFKNYYYTKLCEYGVLNYSYDMYCTDFINAMYYFPFFVAIWFGTLSDEDLIDKNFPFFYIKKLINFYNLKH